ncbi:MAG: diguanylate cyclase domain-containing protein [Ignavibacteriales bacterium]
MAFSLAIWCLSFAFFYVAPTTESAWFWHRLSALGWLLVCPFAAHFFLILSETTKKFKGVFWYIGLYALPVVLIAKTFLTDESPVAKGFVQSGLGWGWTYISNMGSLWWWLYVALIVTCFGLSFFVTYQWAKKSGKKLLMKQAYSIIVLDSVMIAAGFFTDFILPSRSSLIPPLFNIVTIFLAAGLYLIVTRYKLIRVYDAATPDLILGTVMEPILMVNSQGVIEKCNQATADLMKYEEKEILGRKIFEFCDLSLGEPLGFESLLGRKSINEVEIDLIDSRGKVVNTVASFSVVETELEGFIGVVISLHDVTEYKKLTYALDRMANYDKLTNLPNRRMVMDRMESALDDHRNYGSKFALLFLDLDGFKAVNDKYGHVVGDQLLVKVAEMLSSIIRKEDIVARIGGDEFVLLLADLKTEAQLKLVVERIKELFLEPIYIDKARCDVNISIGVSKCPEDATSIDLLMKVADDRMYQNKAVKNH